MQDITLTHNDLSAVGGVLHRVTAFMASALTIMREAQNTESFQALYPTAAEELAALIALASAARENLITTYAATKGKTHALGICQR